MAFDDVDRAPSARIPWIDAAKGYGILLVVVGHVLRGLAVSNLITSPAFGVVDTWIYAFHMPLFFLLSGILLTNSYKKPFQVFFADKLRKIVYPYLIWSVLTVVVKAPLAPEVHYPRHFSDLSSIFYKPFGQFWFLYVLFILSIVAGLLLKLGMRPWLLLLLACVTYPGALPLGSTGLKPVDIAKLYSIYIVLGVMLGQSRWLALLSGFRSRWLFTVSTAGFFAVGVFAYWADENSLSWLRVMLALVGISAVVALSLITIKCKAGRLFELLGRYSLEIFVAHVASAGAVRVIMQEFLHIYDPTMHILFGVLGGLFGPMALATICDRAGFEYAFTFPKSLVRKREPGTAPQTH
jgi:fucose 4-O-acetylase-like acetyltransferase